MTRLYMYMADSAGYRVVESEIGVEDNEVSEIGTKDVSDHDMKYDPRKFKTERADKSGPMLVLMSSKK